MVRSIAETEYYAMASTTSELAWVTYMRLKDFGVPLARPQLFCDNKNSFHMSINLDFCA